MRRLQLVLPIHTFATRIATRRTVFAGGMGYGNVASIDSSAARPAEVCAWAGEEARAVGADMVRMVGVRGTAGDGGGGTDEGGRD